MANYTNFTKDAAKRRKVLARQLAKATRVVEECEREMRILDGVLSALRGLASPAAKGRGRGRRRGRKGRRGGTWQPGKPGRPPDWWREKQKAKKAGGRRGRRGRRAASASPAAAAAT